MAKLTASKRASLPRKAFALPGKGSGPKGAGPGSYPIPDASHARNALARSSGKPVAAAVRAKVKAKFPGIGGGGMTAKQDAKYDKAHGIKAGSAADKKMDAKLMKKPGGGGSSGRGVIGRTPGPKPVKGPAMNKPLPSSSTARATSGGRMPAPRKGSSVRYGTS